MAISTGFGVSKLFYRHRHRRGDRNAHIPSSSLRLRANISNGAQVGEGQSAPTTRDQAHSLSATNHEPGCTRPRKQTHPYVSRSLSAQVAVVRAVFSETGALPFPRRRSFCGDERRRPSERECMPISKQDREGNAERDLRVGLEGTRTSSALNSPQQRDLVGLLNAGEGVGRPMSSLPYSRLTVRRPLVHSRRPRRQETIVGDIARHNGCLDVPPALDNSKLASAFRSRILAYEDRRCSLSRKPNFFDLRTASEEGHTRSLSVPNSCDTVVTTASRRQRLRSLTRAYLDKPLPPLPLGPEQETDSKSYDNTLVSLDERNSPVPNVLGNERRKADTTVCTRWSPGVTHETITRRLHEIREEQITRVMNEHHFHHRVLPVVDVDLLPTRHFVPSEYGLVEVSANEIPSAAVPSVDWLRSEALSRVYCKDFGGDCTGDRDVHSAVSDQLNVAGCKDRHEVFRTESTLVNPPLYREPLVEAERR